jgi:tetratricopeptide (TPR) repeat protein
MYVLGVIREAENRLDEARQAFQTSLDVCRNITPNHFKTGLGYHKMATFLHQEGSHEEALYVRTKELKQANMLILPDRSYLHTALSILETSFDPIPKVARTMFKMSEVLEAMGRADEATAKRTEATRLRSLITAFPYDPSLSPGAFDSLIPSFLR